MSAMKHKNNISTNLLFDIRLQKKTKSNSWVFEKKLNQTQGIILFDNIITTVCVITKIIIKIISSC